jgi:uncharacterized membrane protein HdeD (DUF308 family)
MENKMANSTQSAPSPILRAALVKSLHDHWLVFLIEGIVLIVLGLLAVVVPVIASLAVTIFIGWLFLIGGAVGLAMTLVARHAPGFWLSVLSAAVAIGAGAVLIWWPVGGVFSLTLVLTGYFIADGVVSIMLAIEHRRQFSHAWGWLLAAGIVDLLLAAIIISGLPGTAAWAIGLIVGIDLMFGGSSLVVIALRARTPLL